jgi:ABC-type Na+ efflux pump permease subunit
MTINTNQPSATRTIGAIVRKDLGDAFKNKEILSVLGTVVFLIALYYFLPLLTSDMDRQRIRLYDASGSESTVSQALNASGQFRVFDYEALPVMLDDLAIASYDGRELGLVVPAAADHLIADGEALVLDGYVLHWVSAGEAQTIQSDVEAALSQQIGQPVQVNLAGHTVFSRPDSMGRSISASFALTLIFSLVGIMVAPKLMLEERSARTLSALLVSPASYLQIVIGKALVALVITLLAAGVVIAVNNFIIVQWGLIAIAALCGALFSVAVGLLLGTVFETQQQLTMWTMIIIQPLLIPVFLTIMVDIIPAAAIQIMGFIPPVALSYVVRASFAGQIVLADVLPKLALVIGSTVLLLAINVALIRRMDR